MQNIPDGSIEERGMEGASRENTPDLVVATCPHCGMDMPVTAAFCPACGQITQEAPRARGSVGRFRENIAGAFAYLTFIPAVLFLVVEPYKRNRFVRFHSAQSLLLWAGGTIVALAIRVASIFVLMIPVAGPLFVVLVIVIAALGLFLTWLVLFAKALLGEWFKLWVLGDIAEQYAEPVVRS
jgi:uncharacterized membrane protein